MKLKYIKEYNSYTEDDLYSKYPHKAEQEFKRYNLKNDGIHPMDANSDNKSINGLVEKKRRVGWISSSLDKINQLPDNIKHIKVYNLTDTNSMSYKVGMEKTKRLSGNEWLNLGGSYVDSEYIIYLDGYQKQAEKARKELLKRGGFWKQTNPADDIYMARLMGYGEEYIVPYIRKHFPSFDVDQYIKDYPRNKDISN